VEYSCNGRESGHDHELSVDADSLLVLVPCGSTRVGSHFTASCCPFASRHVHFTAYALPRLPTSSSVSTGTTGGPGSTEFGRDPTLPPHFSCTRPITCIYYGGSCSTSRVNTATHIRLESLLLHTYSSLI